MADEKRTSVKLNIYDLQAIDIIRKEYNLTSCTGSIKYALWHVAKEIGVTGADGMMEKAKSDDWKNRRMVRKK